MGKNIYYGENSNCINITKDKKNIIVGSNSVIMGTLYAYKDSKIKVGDYFYMGNYATIGVAESIIIGNYVIISNDVTIYDNNNHPTDCKHRKKMSMEGFFNENWSWKYAEHKAIVIEDNVWIGQHSTILKGVTIGEGSIVATRSVVTKDVPPYTIVAGNPARVVKKLDK